jgi:hypothetical protein
MKKINARSVLVYVDPDRLTILPDGSVIGGVRVELSQEDSMQAMRDANPRDTEEFSNTHDVSSVWVDDTGGK